MSHHDNSNGGFMGGLILGAIIGAGAALLLTPYDGKKNRQIAKRKGEELMDRAEESFEEFRKAKLDPMMEDVQKDLEKKFESARKDIEKKIKEVQTGAKKKTSK